MVCLWVKYQRHVDLTSQNSKLMKETVNFEYDGRFLYNSFLSGEIKKAPSVMLVSLMLYLAVYTI